MIIFDLICEHEHRFEGWFQDSLAYDVQLREGLLRCPQCDSQAIRKVPSAVAISTRPTDVSAVPGPSTGTPRQYPSSATQLMSLYKQFTEALSAASEDVGNQFAEEARRIHYEETPERLIRGQATDDEFAALQDEGIAVLRLPKIKDEDLN